MGILAAPDHAEFGVGVLDADEGVIAHAFAEAAFVNVGCIEANSGAEVGVLRGSAEAEMTADADSQDTEYAGASGMGL